MGGGPGFGTGQERLGPSCSGHGILKAQGLKNHAQTASGSSALISMRLGLFAWGERAIFRKKVPFNFQEATPGM